MQIEIPDELYEGFITLLDTTQASFTEEEIAAMPENDIKVIKWVEGLLGEKRSKRFKTQDEFAVHIQEIFKKQIDKVKEEIYADKKA